MPKNRIYAVVAHDDKNSLTHAIFNACVASLKEAGAELDILDLYDRAGEIPFYTKDKKVLEAHSFFQENKERFMSADKLLIVYPIYWYASPAILKAWLDIITNFAWSYEGGSQAVPLHSISRSFIINSSMVSALHRRILHGDVECRQMKYSLRWMGVPSVHFHRIGNVKTCSSETIAHAALQSLILVK